MLIGRRFDSDDEQWAPVSDLMAVVMLIFMLIAIILFVNFDLEKRSNEKKCMESQNMLESEFKDDFAEWGAKLEKDLTIRFSNQRILFGAGSSDIEHDTKNGGWFAEMLRNFFPRYMHTIKEIRSKFGENEVLSIRIEGHTSSEHNSPGTEGAFIKNMELSQDRARKILQYVLDPLKVSEVYKYKSMARQLITANGLSSSHLICNSEGKEDKNASRRVEFKLLTNACQKAGRYDEKIDPPCEVNRG